MASNEPSQTEIDQDWENLKRQYVQAGLSELEFLRAQLALSKFGSPTATELKEAKRKAFQAFPD